MHFLPRLLYIAGITKVDFAACFQHGDRNVFSPGARKHGGFNLAQGEQPLHDGFLRDAWGAEDNEQIAFTIPIVATSVGITAKMLNRQLPGRQFFLKGPNHLFVRLMAEDSDPHCSQELFYGPS